MYKTLLIFATIVLVHSNVFAGTAQQPVPAAEFPEQMDNIFTDASCPPKRCRIRSKCPKCPTGPTGPTGVQVFSAFSTEFDDGGASIAAVPTPFGFAVPFNTLGFNSDPDVFGFSPVSTQITLFQPGTYFVIFGASSNSSSPFLTLTLSSGPVPGGTIVLTPNGNLVGTSVIFTTVNPFETLQIVDPLNFFILDPFRDEAITNYIQIIRLN